MFKKITVSGTLDEKFLLWPLDSFPDPESMAKGDSSVLGAMNNQDGAVDIGEAGVIIKAVPGE